MNKEQTHPPNPPNQALQPEFGAHPVLSILDFEIDKIQSEQTRPGWSLWALGAAFAALVWMLTEHLFSPSLNIVNVLQLFVMFSALWTTRHLFALLQTFGQSSSQAPKGFRWAPDTLKRLGALIDGAKATAVFVVSLVCTSGVPAYSRFLAALVYGAMAFFVIVGFLLSMFRLPVRADYPNLSGKLQIGIGIALWVAILITLITVAYGFGFAVSSSVSGFTSVDMRVAILIVAALFLLKQLAVDYSEPPLLGSLIEIRRDLAFSRVSVEGAVERAEIAILGMNEAAVLQEDVRAILQTFEAMESELVIGYGIIDQLRTALNEHSHDLIRTSVVALRASHDRLAGTSNLFHRHIKNLKWRSQWLGPTGATASALEKIVERIETAQKSFTARSEAFVRNGEQLRNEIVAIKTPNREGPENQKL